MKGRNLAKAVIISGVFFLFFVVPIISAATPESEPVPPPGMTKVDIEILGAGRGGAGWALAHAYAAIINKYGPSWLRATGVETRGNIDNLITIWKHKDRRPYTVFYNEEGVSNAASLGLKTWGFKEKISPPKTLAHALTGMTGFISLDPNITKWSDLAGKKIVIDKVGASKNNTSMTLFSVSDFKAKPLSVTLREGLDLLISGQVDAMISPMIFGDAEGGIPTGSIIQLVARKPGKVKFISIPQEIVEKASKASGIGYRYLEAPPKYFVDAFDYPIGGYHFNLVWSIFPEFPDEIAYLLAKLTYKHIGEFKKYHAVGKGTTTGSFGWIATPDLVHKGALKFYQEKGIEITLPMKPIESLRKK